MTARAKPIMPAAVPSWWITDGMTAWAVFIPRWAANDHLAQLAEDHYRYGGEGPGHFRPGLRHRRDTLAGGRFDDFEALVKKFEKRWRGVTGMRHLAHMFGGRLPLLLDDARGADLEPLEKAATRWRK